jgi:hypothetical protein
VGGWFDPRTGEVEFKTSYHHGVAAVSTDPEAATLSCASWVYDDD